MLFILLLMSAFILSMPERLKVSPSPSALPQRWVQNTNVQLPFNMIVKESPMTKQAHEIERQAAALFRTGDYEKLDEYAADIRASKEYWPSGVSHISTVYAGLTLAKTATDIQWEMREKALKDWITARPQSITARVAMASFLTSYAWHARGGGYADTVTEKGWKLFGERLNAAQVVLNEAKQLEEKCPVFWSEQLTVDLGLGVDREEYDADFARALAAEPGYNTYYYDWAYDLLPRWHGTEGEMERKLEKAADKLGGEAGDEMYAQVAWRLHKCVNFKNVIQENNLSWERIDRGFAVIERKFPQSLGAKNERAHLAVLARDRSKAKDYFTQTGGEIDSGTWKSAEEFASFARWAFQN